MSHELFTSCSFSANSLRSARGKVMGTTLLTLVAFGGLNHQADAAPSRQVSRVLADVQAFDRAGDLIGDTSARATAAAEGETADLYFYLYNCASYPQSFDHAQATYVSKGFPWFPANPLFIPGLKMTGTFCYSADVEVSNGQSFRTEDLLTGVDGEPYHLDPAIPSVTLAYNTVAPITIPLWEQVDFSDDTEISWEKIVEVEMTDEWIAEINSLTNPQFQMSISGCLAYGQTSLTLTDTYQANKGLLVGVDNSSVFLVNDALCTLHVSVFDGSMLRADGEVDFISPLGNGIPVKIDDLPLEIHDSGISATFKDMGNFVNMSLSLPQGLIDYLDGFDQSDLRYEMTWQKQPTYSNSDLVVAPLTRSGDELSGTAQPLDDAEYRVTLTIYEGNNVVIQSVEDVDLTGGDMDASFTWDYSVIITSDVQNLTNVYAHAFLEGSSSSGGIAVYVEGLKKDCVPGVCTDPTFEVSCVTGASIDPATGAQDPDTGANACLARVPFGTIQRVTFTHSGYVTEVLENDIVVNSLSSINLPNVILEAL